MSGQERIKKPAPSKQETDELAAQDAEVQAAQAKQPADLSETDALLDEIDAVLDDVLGEESAQEFVDNFRQKGGQ